MMKQLKMNSLWSKVGCYDPLFNVYIYYDNGDLTKSEIKIVEFLIKREYRRIYKKTKENSNKKREYYTLGKDFFIVNIEDVFECMEDYWNGRNFCEDNHLDFDEDKAREIFNFSRENDDDTVNLDGYTRAMIDDDDEYRYR